MEKINGIQKQRLRNSLIVFTVNLANSNHIQILSENYTKITVKELMSFIESFQKRYGFRYATRTLNYLKIQNPNLTIQECINNLYL